jgi:nitrite reductase/ring-hydroxylating ferredoxin subunit
MTPAWTPAILSPDLPPGLVAPSFCDGAEVAVWRGHSGRVAAWIDRCPHRGMRLSHGFVRGDLLSCLYHGWRFDEDGRCRKIPAHPDLEPPGTIRTQAIACTEAGGVVWVAAAAPDAPPPSLAGLAPLRSLTLDADPEALAEAAGLAVTDGALQLAATADAPALRLLLQPLRTGTTIHALAAPARPASLVAASRALEDLRRRAEALAGPEAA